VTENVEKCPKCGSTKVVPILYGLFEVLDPEFKPWRDFVRGGCCISEENRYCLECETSFIG
jgi:hypothetical protein